MKAESTDIGVTAIVAIGASAGGVPALTELVAALPMELPAAVFVVMHLAPHSRSYLAEILQRVTRLPVALAKDGEPIVPGSIRVAPPDQHLALEPGHVRLTRSPRECRARPAVDVLFRSAATAYGSRVIGVVLSGALDDGTAGLWAVKDRGGLALVQDPETAEHRSMPDSALRLVKVDAVLPPSRLGAEIGRLAAAMEPVADTPASERLRIETDIALRAVEERESLLRELADAAVRSGEDDAATHYRAQADDTDRRVQALRNPVLDHRFLGPAAGPP